MEEKNVKSVIPSEISAVADIAHSSNADDLGAFAMVLRGSIARTELYRRE